MKERRRALTANTLQLNQSRNCERASASYWELREPCKPDYSQTGGFSPTLGTAGIYGRTSFVQVCVKADWWFPSTHYFCAQTLRSATLLLLTPDKNPSSRESLLLVSAEPGRATLISSLSLQSQNWWREKQELNKPEFGLVPCPFSQSDNSETQDCGCHPS